MAVPYTAERRDRPATPDRPSLALPVRFQGRACFAIDPEDAIQVLDAALRRVARPEAVTTDEVGRYCRIRGIADERMEYALLRQAVDVVSREVLLERLVSAADRRLAATAEAEIDIEGLRDRATGARGGTLVDSYRGTVYREDRSVIMRLSLGSSLEPPLTVTPGQNLRPRASRAVPVSGTLRIEGSFQPLGEGRVPARMRVHWRVQRGAASLNTGAIASLSAPLQDVVACVGAGALARFGEVLPGHLAALARADRGPAFVHVERFFRFGWVSEKTRAYLLCWQRLRDYLLWRAQLDI
ncbi:hypothetical protein [Haliangium sp.]